MFLGEGVFGLLLLFLWGYCIFDVIRTEASSVQHLPKMLWLLLVVFIPTIGSLAWLLLGRPRGNTFKIETSLRRDPSHPSRRSRPDRTAPPPEPPRPSLENFQAKREEALRRYEAEREREREREEERRRRTANPDESPG